MYLLDTMVVSEATAKKPDQNTMRWLKLHGPANSYVSSVTIGEILFGIKRLGPSRRRENLESWYANTLYPTFGSRILSFDEQAAQAWAELRRLAGRTFPHLDLLNAAIAHANDLVIVTRNRRDFAGLPVRIEDPWSS